MLLEMANGVKTHGEDLVGSRLEVRWPNYYSFRRSFVGIVTSQCHSGKKLGKATTTHPRASSCKHSQMVNTGSDFNKMIVHCWVKAWRPKSKAWCKFVVTSYNSSLKKHLVTFASGATEMLKLSRGRKKPATQNLQNQEVERNNNQGQLPGKYPLLACKRIIRDPPCDAGPTQNDVADRPIHVSRKSKVQSSNSVLPGTTSPVNNRSQPKDDKEQTPKNTTPPPDPVTSISQNPNQAVDINGYNVKATAAPILESIFAKYGDIANNCLFKSKSVRASLLEVICDVVQKLQNYYSDAIFLNLETIQNEVADVESAKIDVSWLKQHLAKFHEVSGFRKENLLLKKCKENMGLVVNEASENLRKRRVEMFLAQKRVKEAEKYVDVMKLVGRKIDDEILASENEEYFWRRRLGGLLEPDEGFDMQG